MIVGHEKEAIMVANAEIKVFEALDRNNQHIVGYFGGGFSRYEPSESGEAYIIMEFCKRGHLFGLLSLMQSKQQRFVSCMTMHNEVCFNFKLLVLSCCSLKPSHIIFY